MTVTNTEQLCTGCARLFRPVVTFDGAYCRDCAQRFRPEQPNRRVRVEHTANHLHASWAGNPTWTRELEAVPGWLRLPAKKPGRARAVISASSVVELRGIRNDDDRGNVALTLLSALGSVVGFLFSNLWHLPSDPNHPEPPRREEPETIPLRERATFRLEAVLAGGATELHVDALVDPRELTELAHRIHDLRHGQGPAPAGWTSEVLFMGTRPILVRPTRSWPPEEGHFKVEPEHLVADIAGLHLDASPDGMSWHMKHEPARTVDIDDIKSVVAEELGTPDGSHSFQLTLTLRKEQVQLAHGPTPGLPLFLEQELRRLWRMTS